MVNQMYRVDVLLPHNAYVEYTSRKGVALELATALGNYLKWRKAGGRIVDLFTGYVLDEWPRLYTPQAADAFRAATEELRNAAQIKF